MTMATELATTNNLLLIIIALLVGIGFLLIKQQSKNKRASIVYEPQTEIKENGVLK
ncbi:TPA: hypothetical protein ACPKA4_001750 [Haemophilus influenzae]